MTVQLALAVTLLLGVPLLLLAIGVLAHAYLLARPRRDATPEALVEAMVAESVDQLLAQLRAGALDAEHTSERARSSSVMPVAPPSLPALGAPPSAFGAPLGVAAAPFGANLAQAVAQLVGEGLSDRSIARRLSVGIEEVRVARGPERGPR